MTRVLVIEPAGNLWGSERALLDLLDHAVGIELAVCLPPGRPLERELQQRGIRMLPYYIYALHEKTKLHRLVAAFGVLLACWRFRPTVLYLNQTGAYKIAWPAAVLLRIPMVTHIRIFEDVAYLARQRPSPKVVRGVIAISGSIEREIASHPELGILPCLQLFDSYALHRRSNGPRPERMEHRIGCVGRIVPIKGQDVLVEAVARMPPQDPAVECLVAGDGDRTFVAGLRRAAAASPRPDEFRWLGIVYDVELLLQSCELMVAPSHREALGRVIFEAWEAGAVPVVYGGSGGAAEMVTAADGGLIYPEQTAQSLADTLLQGFALSAAERARLIANGRSWMAKYCNAVRYGRKIVDILQEVSDQARPRLVLRAQRTARSAGARRAGAGRVRG